MINCDLLMFDFLEEITNKKVAVVYSDHISDVLNLESLKIDFEKLKFKNVKFIEENIIIVQS